MTPSRDAPICRWISEGMKLDVMPFEEHVLGFSNRWYKLAAKTATVVELGDGIEIRLITAACFIATKLEALALRSGGDYRMSPDLEDIIVVLDGRPELIGEVKESGVELRQYIAARLRKLLGDADFVDAIPACLLPDETSQARTEVILERARLLGKADS